MIEEDHPARSIWTLVGGLDLSLYYARIGAVEGRAGRDHTDPHLLISLWIYAYSRGISSAREIERLCEYDPGFQWLCGLGDCFTCPAGRTMTHQATLNREHGVRTHVYRAPKGEYPKCPLRAQCASRDARPDWYRSVTRLEEPEATTAFKARMETGEARAIYKQRSEIAEFPHAWLKERCGLRQFRCRGRIKATMEATWACLSYNIIRWFAIRREAARQAATAAA